ncbi:hypothetical protein QRX50_35655 [Amycolatopsis carbonis]|uniref:Uncharacterized protein n=1 Tax=Amycolatopsis carbonis TaxID=715471 RepID=A0A9Y2IAC8_9PSEU|nr:hypothetical protein [Amycolatopsis sp. 2-15]WIX76745.1 hypothetical protein QRX50_35655 [Amycolatopsis sp. 2-15]
MLNRAHSMSRQTAADDILARVPTPDEYDFLTSMGHERGRQRRAELSGALTARRRPADRRADCQVSVLDDRSNDTTGSAPGMRRSGPASLLRDRIHSVALTGDGADDAPAIRLAHVDITLRATATPATREAADLVIPNDRSETITDAVAEGRAMWASVRDALSILLGSNLGEVASTLGAGLLSTRDARNARQLLLTHVLPAMAGAVRPPPDASAEDLCQTKNAFSR